MNVKNLSVCYGAKTVFNNFSLDLPTGKTTCILGPSGCGKTTLLRAIAGVLPYDGIIENAPEKVAFIFQNPLLIPSMTVEKNVEYVLKTQIKDKKMRKKRVSDILQQVGLRGEEKSYPASLSGGMAQRVSLARAFCYPSDVLLMDEPFKGLDVSLKKQIISLFLRLLQEQNKTVVFVTHDPDEALFLGDKIVVLQEDNTAAEFTCDVPYLERTPYSLAELKEKIDALL